MISLKLMLPTSDYDFSQTPISGFKVEYKQTFSLLVGQAKPEEKHYDNKQCYLCRSSIATIHRSKKLWRWNNLLAPEFTKMLGPMITKDIVDFSVHQLCLDYAHGKVLQQKGHGNVKTLIKNYLKLSQFFIPIKNN
jgi:hypothetical protein